MENKNFIEITMIFIISIIKMIKIKQIYTAMNTTADISSKANTWSIYALMKQNKII